jgi:hypothetical protein
MTGAEDIQSIEATYEEGVNHSTRYTVEHHVDGEPPQLHWIGPASMVCESGPYLLLESHWVPFGQLPVSRLRLPTKPAALTPESHCRLWRNM